LHRNALEGSRVADESIAGELYDRLGEGNFAVQRGRDTDDVVVSTIAPSTISPEERLTTRETTAPCGK
jgi:hypothetical protein